MADANHRCGYCQMPQVLSPIPLEIDHLVPLGAGGTDDEHNLWAACAVCNARKGDRIRAGDPATGETAALFSPREQDWNGHFQWDETGTRATGLTPSGRATVEALQLNDDLAVAARARWVEGGWFPPPEG